MKFVATANLKLKINATAVVKYKITAAVNMPILAPDCPLYSLIDGGTPSWVYTPIAGFNLISGGNP